MCRFYLILLVSEISFKAIFWASGLRRNDNLMGSILAFAGRTISWLVFRPSPESEVIHYIRACFRYHLVRFRRRPESPLLSSHALVILAKARTSTSFIQFVIRYLSIPAEAGISLFTISNLSFSRRREPPRSQQSLSFSRRREPQTTNCHSRGSGNPKTLIVIPAEAGTPR